MLNYRHVKGTANTKVMEYSTSGMLPIQAILHIQGEF